VILGSIHRRKKKCALIGSLKKPARLMSGWDGYHAGGLKLKRAGAIGEDGRSPNRTRPMELKSISNKTKQLFDRRTPHDLSFHVGECVVGCDVICCEVVWCGVVWYGVVRCGQVWYGVVWCVWCGFVWSNIGNTGASNFRNTEVSNIGNTGTRGYPILGTDD